MFSSTGLRRTVRKHDRLVALSRDRGAGSGMMLALGAGPSMAQSRAHVYLLRGLLNVFSLGMDTLAD